MLFNVRKGVKVGVGVNHQEYDAGSLMLSSGPVTPFNTNDLTTFSIAIRFDGDLIGRLFP